MTTNTDEQPTHIDAQPATEWTVRHATENDAVHIRSFWNRYFDAEPPDGGEGVVAAAVGDNEYSWAVVAVADNAIVGAGVAANYPRSEMRDAVLPHEPVHEYLGADNAYLNFAAVAPPYRGRGIGTALVERRVELLRDHAPATRAFAISWLRRGDRPSSAAIFESLGWTEIAHVDRFYQRHGDRGDACPDCAGACRCDAKIYAVDL
jgi:GNAT superfamily N-acetyltransferase